MHMDHHPPSLTQPPKTSSDGHLDHDDQGDHGDDHDDRREC